VLLKKTKQFWVRLDEDTAEKLLRIAQGIGISRATLTTMIIKRTLQDHKKLNLNHLVLNASKQTK
jgi:hypothetical protein